MCLNDNCYGINGIFKIDISNMSTYIDPRPTAAGNILVIASFYFYRNLRTINNYLILNLAIADLIIGVYSMNVYTVYVTQGERPNYLLYQHTMCWAYIHYH